MRLTICPFGGSVERVLFSVPFPVQIQHSSLTQSGIFVVRTELFFFLLSFLVASLQRSRERVYSSVVFDSFKVRYWHRLTLLNHHHLIGTENMGNIKTNIIRFNLFDIP